MVARVDSNLQVAMVALHLHSGAVFVDHAGRLGYFGRHFGGVLETGVVGRVFSGGVASRTR